MRRKPVRASRYKKPAASHADGKDAEAFFNVSRQGVNHARLCRKRGNHRGQVRRYNQSPRV